MKRAVAYMRMSTDKQEHSIDSQYRLIQDYADKNSIILIGIYSDEGISGRNAEKRPQFMQMIEDSTNGTFDCVLIYDSSRFARNLEQSLVYKSILKKNGVTLLSVTEPILDEDTSLITDALMGAMNEMYSRKLSKNVKRGMEQKALRGEFLSAPPFGYRRIKHLQPIEIDTEEAEVITYIFSQYHSGKSPFSIAQELNNRGVKTRFGNSMERRSIIYILKNPTYKGYLKWSCDAKTIYKKADHKPIISESLFDEVQQKLLSNKKDSKPKSRPPESYKHWLSGIIYCSACGSVYTYSKGYDGRKNRFRCSGYTKGKCTSSKSITVEELEEIVVSTLTIILPSDLNYCYFTPCKSVPFSKESYQSKIKKLNLSLERAKQAYLQNVDTLSEYKIQKSKINLEIENLNALIKQEETFKNSCKTKPNVKLINFITLFQNENNIVRHTIIKSMIYKIIIHEQQNIIEFIFY